MKYSDKLDFLFHPRTIAIAGVSGDMNKFNGGLKYYEGLKSFGFKGVLYPMNPAGGEIDGRKIYTSVKEIPGSVDFVISAIPARHTPQLVEDCLHKGVRAIHFFTSGFGEIEDEKGKKLQAEVIGKAKRGGIRVVGPNCLGLYCPSGGLTFSPDLSPKSGTVAMISQSGGNAAHCANEGNDGGVFFSKVISMGNGADLNESDYLEYLAQDSETTIITGYIEGVREGPRFLRALRSACDRKPVILLKVGTSKPGAEAAVSHTTALAGSDDVWSGMLKQVGAIRAGSVEEMIDVTIALQRMQPPAGNRVVIAGIGGGASVIMADGFSSAGLELPRLNEKVRKDLIALYPNEAGRIFKNPVDLNYFETPDIFFNTIKTIENYNETDIVVIQVAFDHYGLISNREKELFIGLYKELIRKLKGKISKPLAVVLHSYANEDTRKIAHEMKRQLIDDGFAVFPSMQRAAVALGKYAAYYSKRKPSPAG